jgi:hypothetical protein
VCSRGPVWLRDRGAVEVATEETVTEWFGRYFAWREARDERESIDDSRGRIRKWVERNDKRPVGTTPMKRVTRALLEDFVKDGKEKDRTKTGRARIVQIEPSLASLLRVLVEGRQPDDRIVVVGAHNRCASTFVRIFSSPVANVTLSTSRRATRCARG